MYLTIFSFCINFSTCALTSEVTATLGNIGSIGTNWWASAGPHCIGGFRTHLETWPLGGH